MQPFPCPKDATDKFWLKSANWSWRYICSKVWTMMTDARALLYYKLTLWAFGSGELINLELLKCISHLQLLPNNNNNNNSLSECSGSEGPRAVQRTNLFMHFFTRFYWKTSLQIFGKYTWISRYLCIVSAFNNVYLVKQFQVFSKQDI